MILLPTERTSVLSTSELLKLDLREPSDLNPECTCKPEWFLLRKKVRRNPKVIQLDYPLIFRLLSVISHFRRDFLGVGSQIVVFVTE
jgi:hypothetical protein